MIIEEIEMVYENRMETVPSELNALNAVYEPAGQLQGLAGVFSGRSLCRKRPL